ncbi:MAG: hypothetical protein ACM337_02445 [Syntrophaceae bacterium]
MERLQSIIRTEEDRSIQETYRGSGEYSYQCESGVCFESGD